MQIQPANSYAAWNLWGNTREYTCQDMKKSTAIKSFLPINKPYQFLKLHVLGSDGRSASRGRGQNSVVLLNVNESDVTPGRGIGPRHTPRHSVYKGDRAKVGGWNIRCKILEQPLRALKAKRNAGSQTLRHRVAVGQIFNLDLAGSRGERDDSESDDVSSRDSDA